jgi:hypothetical protein
MLRDGIPGSELVIIDGADHALIWTHPDELLRVMDEFLGPDRAWSGGAPIADVTVPPDLGVVARQPDRWAGDRWCCWWRGIERIRGTWHLPDSFLRHGGLPEMTSVTRDLGPLGVHERDDAFAEELKLAELVAEGPDEEPLYAGVSVGADPLGALFGQSDWQGEITLAGRDHTAPRPGGPPGGASTSARIASSKRPQRSWNTTPDAA